MLPSFRLIAATFLCGFVVVFAGLRLAISLNSTHAAFPVMAAHAAPIPVTPIADADMRRSQSSVPVMYDPRFVVRTASLTPIHASLVVPPAAPPLDITPPAVGKVTQDELPPLPGAAVPAKPSTTIAAIPPAAAAVAAPAQAAAGQAAAEPLKPQVAAVDPQPPKPAAAPAFDIPLIEPATVDLSLSAADRVRIEQDKTAAVEPAGALSSLPSSNPAPAQPDAAIPMPEPKATAAPRARAKIIRKPRARTARRTESTDPFGGFDNASQPFGTPK